MERILTEYSEEFEKAAKMANLIIRNNIDDDEIITLQSSVELQLNSSPVHAYLEDICLFSAEERAARRACDIPGGRRNENKLETWLQMDFENVCSPISFEIFRVKFLVEMECPDITTFC